MARYEKGRKDETRKRIVRIASERFRQDGIDGVGVAALMADSGLTHGGFYAHFKSKEALVAEAMAHALGSLATVSSGQGDAREKLAALIEWYLSPKHRDRPAKGCPLAALAPDLARRSKAMRSELAQAGQSTIDRIVAGLPADLQGAQRNAQADAVFSHLLGTLQLSRFASSKARSDEILATGRRVARQIAGLDDPRVASAR